MFYCKGIEKADLFKKRGVCKEIKITEGGNEMFASVDYDEKENALIVNKGNAIVCLLKEVGVHDEAVLEVIFVNDETMLVTLLQGEMYVKSSKDQMIKIDTAGSTSLYVPTNKCRVYWLNANTVLRCTKPRLTNMYGVPFTEDIPAIYRDNLRYICRANYTDNSTLVFNCEMVEGTLGLQEFPMYTSVERKNYFALSGAKSSTTPLNIEDNEDYDEDYEDYDIEDLIPASNMSDEY